MDNMLHITPTIQELLQAHHKKHAYGDETQLQAQRQAIIDVVLARFPSLQRLAQQQTSTSNNTPLLATLVTRLVLAYNEQEAKLLLLSIHPAG